MDGGAMTMQECDYYFAYGVHLDMAMMRQLCPGAEPVGLAKLPGHALIMTAGGTAGLVAKSGGEVWGRLWRLQATDVAALETRPGVPQLYTGQRVEVELANGQRQKRVLAYVNVSRKTGQATTGYIYTVVAAARQAGFPQAWIDRLADLNP
jgi:gamma-glutamylcyclotransferase (GGCT)/AIG2-like uncharacterized protein YtfP